MGLRFLTDESCDIAVLTALREAGYESAAVSERCPGAADSDVIALAFREARVLVTEDKRFGQLVFASGQRHEGVVLLRYPYPMAHVVAAQLVDLAGRRDLSWAGVFLVIQPGRIRLFRPPAL